MKINLLVVDDDPFIHKILDKLLADKISEQKIHIVHCDSPESATKEFEITGFHICFVDLNYENSTMDGFSLLKKLNEIDPNIEIVVLSSQNDFKSAQKSLRMGASDYLVKGFGSEEFFLVLDRILERRKWKKIEANLKNINANYGVDQIIGNSNAIKNLKNQIKKFSKTNISILIEAETGSGKELVARSIHDESDLDGGSFCAVDCGAIPKGLADSYFFGHEKGAFTGAQSSRVGVFERADGGTLFLDEINSLDQDTQSKLLRVLQEREFRRLGSNKVLSSDFRLVAASNEPLEELVEAGKFREDLFYRINGLQISIPPLRERFDDLKLLIQHILPTRKISSELLQVFKSYWWPGNIRELKNILLALDVLTEGREEISKLPEEIQTRFKAKKEVSVKNLKKIKQDSRRDEYKFFSDSYKNVSGNISELSRKLSMDRSYLHQKLVRMGIHKIR